MPTWKLGKWGEQRGGRAVVTAAVAFVVFGGLAISASAQTILFNEDFEAAYNPGARQFTTIGEGFCDGVDNGDLRCTAGLGFWASNVTVEAIRPGETFIGPPVLTGARKAGLLWDGQGEDVGVFTEDAWDVLFATVDWLVSGKDANLTTIRVLTGDVAWAGDPENVEGPANSPGSIETANRLRAEGYTLAPVLFRENGNQIDPLPLPEPGIDMDLFWRDGGVFHHPVWAATPTPWLGLVNDIHGDIGTSNRNPNNGTNGTEPPDIWRVSVPVELEGHPALAGKTGTFDWTNAVVGLNDVGTNPAPGAQLPLTYSRPQPKLLESLAEAESLLGGFLNADFVLENQVIDSADFRQSAGAFSALDVGHWFPGDPPGIGDQLLNNEIPGMTTDDSYAILSTGTLNVSSGAPQTFSFALSKLEKSDGGKLVIDGMTVIEDDGNSTLDSFGQIQLGSGDHTLEWTAYHRGTVFVVQAGTAVNAGFELSVSEIADNSSSPNLNNFWEVVGDDFSTNSRISLVADEIFYDAYRLFEPGTPRVQGAMLLMEEGASLHGGGVVGTVGNYWGSVDTNHTWGGPTDDYSGGSSTTGQREMILDPIDTNAAGSDPINLSFLLAATPGGFENSDEFSVWVDPEDDGSFISVAHFAGDAQSNFASVTVNPKNGQPLDFQGLPETVNINTIMKLVTVSLPPSVNFQSAARIKFKTWQSFTNELVVVDELVVHTGSLGGGAPNGVLSLSGFGETHTENFDGLGVPGSALPNGWSATISGSTNSVITLPFPVGDVVLSQVYNAGKADQPDRTLATGNTDGTSSNRIQLWGELTGSAPVGAVMLDTRIEAWVGDGLNANDPGEAAYIISLEFDADKDGSYDTAVTFNGGAIVTTGLTLSAGVLNGNTNPHSADFSSGLTVLASQIPAGSDIRLAFDAQAVGQTQGYLFGVDDLMFRVVAPGDTDGNGEVDSNDLFAILGAAKFNNPGLGPATWGEGDFTGDALVDSDDLFAMLGAAKFNAGPYTVESSGAAHSVMTATIDPATGIVTLDATAVGAAGEVVSGWRIQSASGIFTGDAPTIAPSFFNTDKDTEVSTGFIALTGVQELGSIIGQEHVGQSVGFYADDISGDFTMDAAQGNFLLEIHVIPEPSSLMLAALGLVSLAGYGWRRRRTAA